MSLTYFQQLPTQEAHQQQVLECLAGAFGAEFELWTRSSEDERWSSVADGSSPGETESSALAEALAEKSPHVQIGLAAQCDLAIPIPRKHGRSLFATASFTEVDPDQLLRQAHTVLDALRLKDENQKLKDINGSLTLQVTENFEELAFVRALASHLQLPGSSADPLRAAPEILEKLRLTIKAESLGLVLAESSDDEDSSSELPQYVLPPLWAGEMLLNDSKMASFMDQFRAESSERPLIINHIHSTQITRDFPELRQCVIVRVGQDVVRGWLVGFNRILNDLGRKDYRVSEQEFGTVEATLMQSAASSLATHFHNVALLRQKEDLFTEVVKALVNAVEARDPYTCGHSERVALYSQRLAMEAGLTPEACDQIYLSGLLHDVGKIGVSDATLRKPGQLTDEEFQEISRHPDQGWAILHDLRHLRDIMPGVLYHHERYDGKGYPLGLAGEKIPIQGRIMAICDAYDAMTSDRPYRKGMPQERAEEILRGGAGVQWDPVLVEAFFAAVADIIHIRDTYQPRQHPALPDLSEPS